MFGLWQVSFDPKWGGPAEPVRFDKLELRVVSLWTNRMICDEQLPEDSDCNPSGNLKSWPA